MAIKKNAPNYLKISKQPFTTLINKTIDLIPDPAAVGIYVYLASKQSDWIIQEKDLMNRFGVGRDYIRSRMKILKDVGLLIKQAIRSDKGQILHWETILLNDVSENTPPGQVDQITENPPSGKPRHLDNPTHINKRSIEINNNNIITGISDEIPQDNNEKFEEFNNQTLGVMEAEKGLDGSSTYIKSDYHNNQPEKESIDTKSDQILRNRDSTSSCMANAITTQQIVDAYHETLPDCPRIKVIDSKLHSQLVHMRKNWPKYQKEGKDFSIESFKDYLNYLKQHYSWFIKPYTTANGNTRRNNLRVFTREINITKIVNGEFSAN